MKRSLCLLVLCWLIRRVSGCIYQCLCVSMCVCVYMPSKISLDSERTYLDDSKVCKYRKVSCMQALVIHGVRELQSEFVNAYMGISKGRQFCEWYTMLREINQGAFSLGIRPAFLRLRRVTGHWHNLENDKLNGITWRNETFSKMFSRSKQREIWVIKVHAPQVLLPLFKCNIGSVWHNWCSQFQKEDTEIC